MKLENVIDVYPLTPAQQGMLFHTVTEPGKRAYQNHAVIDLSADVSIEKLRSVLQGCCERHDALRTAIVWEGLDDAVQVVRENVEFCCDYRDCRGQGQAATQQQLDAVIEETSHLGFNLAEAPLIRFVALEKDNHHWALVIHFHHIILDGWSLRTLVREIVDSLNGSPANNEPFRFRQYAAWLQNQDMDAALEYWARRLDGVTPSLIVEPEYFETGNGMDQPTHQELTGSLSPQLSDGLRDVARQQRITLNTLFQAAWSIVVGRYAGSDDIVYGTTVAGRPLQLPYIENGIGSFINTVPFRAQIRGDESLMSWLGTIQSEQVRSQSWDFAPLASIQRRVETGSDRTLFDNILVFENYPHVDEQFPAGTATIQSIRHIERSNFAVSLIVQPANGIQLFLIVDQAIVPVGMGRRMLDHLCWVLQAIAEATESTKLQELLTLPPQQREKLLSAGGWSSTLPESVTSVFELMQAHCARAPQQVAVRCGRDSLSYGQLQAQASQFAGQLSAVGVGQGNRVGICAERGIEWIVAIVGCFRAGCAYVPLDPDYPPEHLEFIVRDAELAAIAVAKSTGELPFAHDLPMVPVEAAQQSTPGVDDALPNPRGDAEAYVIYTSGSSGQPKGVVVSHHNLAASTRARFDYYDHPPKSYLLLSSFAFDSSVAGIFWTLSAGGTLVIPAPGAAQKMHELADTIESAQVTHLLCLPALYRLLIEGAKQDQLRSLQVAIVAGEALSSSVVVAHRAALPHVELHNEYGPTEATVWCTAAKMPTSAEAGGLEQRPSIGWPIPGTKVQLLDKWQCPVPYGCVGEIYVCSPGVVKGYLNRDALTRERFMSLVSVDDIARRWYRTGDLGYFRDDGALMFCGRADRQIKLRGFRVELPEIEAAILRATAAREVAVTTRPSGRATRLVAYVCGLDDVSPVRDVLASKMPQFMVPDDVVALDALPRLANGKINERALPSPQLSDARAVSSPTGAVEQQLLAIWQKVLGVDPIGVEDNFFALGGDSIMAIQVVSQARREGLQVEPRQLIEFATISQLAAAVAPTQPEVEVSKATSVSALAPIQKWFFDSRHPHPAHWNQSRMFTVQGGYAIDLVKEAVTLAFNHHAMLTARFVETETGMQLDCGQAAALKMEESPWDGMHDGSFVRRLLEYQSSLNLQQGPVCRLIWFQNSQGNDCLYCVAHHLVMDAVSWQILLDDIEYLCAERHKTDQWPQLPTPTAYTEWVRRQADHVQNSLQDERTYWQEITNKGNQLIDQVCGARAESTYAVEAACLDGALVEALFGDANQAYNTTVYELLLSAFVAAAGKWGSQSQVYLELEGHGRDHLNGDLDLSRTVGWFSCTYPALFDLAAAAPESCIPHVKESLRAVPHGGVSYNLLRYATQDGETEWKNGSGPQLLFNYLGRASTSNGRALQPLPISNATDRAAENLRFRTIEVNVHAAEGELHIRLAHCTDDVGPADARRLLDEFCDRLEHFISHCTRQETTFTVSDFPTSGLSQTELDEFLDGLG